MKQKRTQTQRMGYWEVSVGVGQVKRIMRKETPATINKPWNVIIER